jgi:deazaflavin-dependent oxidoreductase (nitroreductase family)
MDMGWLAGIALSVVGVAATAAALFYVGMRTKNRFVQGAVIEFTKKVVNPRMRGTAGTPGATAALIRNVGRSSGRLYETPVGAEPVDGGFVVALPYGERPNWLRNVLAAGETTLVHDGREHRVDQPAIVALEPFARAFGPSDQTLHRVFGVKTVLWLRSANESTAISSAA